LPELNSKLFAMPLADLSPEEREVVKGCLRAAVEGPFFPDSEFHTIFGLDRDVVRDVLASWPNLDDGNESVMIAINNSFNNLLGYPHGREGAWPQFIAVSSKELGQIDEKWRGKCVRGYFDGLM
jgi:hypothetical protein